MTRKLHLSSVLWVIFVCSICSALPAQNADPRILFSSRVYQHVGRSYEQLWEISLRDGQKVKLSATARSHNQPLCSPERQSIVFISGGQGSWRDEIWLWDRRNGQERRLLKANGQEHFGYLLGWSADGKELFLSMGPRGNAKLQIQREELIRLPEDSALFFAPDGRMIETQGKKLADLREGKLSPDGEKLAYVNGDSTQLQVTQTRDGKNLVSIPLPQKSEHWNYPTSVSWSPDGKRILVGGEAGGSTAHFEDYWLLDLDRQKWQYAGGGIAARWSPDGSEIMWSTPRELAPLRRKRGGSKCPAIPGGTYDPCQFHYEWVSHLVLVEIPSLQQQTLTSGVSYDTDPSWCAK